MTAGRLGGGFGEFEIYKDGVEGSIKRQQKSSLARHLPEGLTYISVLQQQEKKVG
eukprot:CAMPEP_0168349932 /NCGR_PEP_ID=MMETSP0213-20121227/20774_1 /TAXON_ID=151035 /ORGANISM="Euplotes harpa, Strain FSP1.4" /LENGTH=54 /DNA_ID=CAMNT_0008360095 /DNA_START=524 /DNA_END=683 /DNA_ORIENTATION=-